MNAPLVSAALAASQLVIWRHPKPKGAEGLCIGQADLPVDPRKIKRLAHRIQRSARRHGWPRVIHTSPLQRCALVGRQLRRWGWRHHTDAGLLEMHFGAWDGLPWGRVPHTDVEVWVGDFLHHAPGGGESLHAFMSRVEQWLRSTSGPILLVGHAGWMRAAQWVSSGQPWPEQAAQWPRSPAHMQALRLDINSVR